MASAGPDQTGLIGFPVLLDGTGSNDPDGVPSPLSFAWTQIEGPPVTLSGADTAQASFIPSALGAYAFRLVVSDGAAEADDTVAVVVVNQAPIADAGPDQTGLAGVTVLLDGTGSLDPDGAPSPLSFAWTQTDGPPVTIEGADTAQPRFTPAALGTYAFRLVVSDGAAEADDTVAVTVVNQGPIADAGPDQTGLAGDQILLDGSGSQDPDGAPAPLSFAWTQTEGPPVTLAGADQAVASFTPAALGTYSFRLVVSDGEAEDDDTVAVTILNQGPTANAGPDQTGRVGTAVVLEGGGSTDPDGQPSPLSFAWTQTAGPPVTLVGADTARPRFTPAASGTHTFRLVVSDGEAEDDDVVSVIVELSSAVVFADDFEQARGWTTNPGGTDTATTGRWERAVPQATMNGNVPMQLRIPTSGSFDLVTGGPAGADVGANDIDNGTTSIRSPEITLPIGQLTLSFSYYLAHLTNATSADFLRVRVVGKGSQVALQELGAATDRAAAWQSRSVDISSLAGQRVRILIEAADAASASLVEAAIDDMRIEAQF